MKRQRPPPPLQRDGGDLLLESQSDIWGLCTGWAGRCIGLLPSEGQALLARVLGEGMHVSTHYSGMGCAGECTRQLAEAVARAGADGLAFTEERFDFFHAADISKKSQQVLCAAPAPGYPHPRHVFGDMCARFDGASVNTVRNLVLVARTKLQCGVKRGRSCAEMVQNLEQDNGCNYNSLRASPKF